MTYQQLLNQLKKLTPAQLEAEVRYQDTHDGEFYGVQGINTNGADYDLPDDTQPILRIEQ